MEEKNRRAGNPRARSAMHHCSSGSVPVRQVADAADREFRDWMRRYRPIEMAIIAERERHQESKRRRAAARRRAFGDLCEVTEGLAAFARRGNMTLEEAERRLRRIRPFHPVLALPCLLLEDAWTAACAIRRILTRRIDRAKHEAVRPAYYARERERRQALAAERRKVRMRHTLNPCPTRMEILDAWTRVKDSPEALLRFGGLMEDLECYVDNSLKRTDGGVIVGRQSGIKGWLQMEIPALYMKYKTVMAYKAAAKRMRQVLDIRDPLPLSAALPRRGKTLGHGADEINGRGSGKRGIRGDKRLRKPGGRQAEGDEGGKNGDGRKAMVNGDENRANGCRPMCETDELEVLRAQAVCAEVLTGVVEGHGMTAALMRRLGDLTDPERVEDANMLAEWKERYRRKITVRTKSMWGRQLRLTG